MKKHSKEPDTALIQAVLLHPKVETPYSFDILYTYMSRTYPFPGDPWDELQWLPYTLIGDDHAAPVTWARAGINFLTHSKEGVWAAIPPAGWFLELESKVRLITEHKPTLDLAERLEAALDPASDFLIDGVGEYYIQISNIVAAGNLVLDPKKAKRLKARA